jgi:hypothetical protein
MTGQKLAHSPLPIGVMYPHGFNGPQPPEFIPVTGGHIWFGLHQTGGLRPVLLFALDGVDYSMWNNWPGSVYISTFYEDVGDTLIYYRNDGDITLSHSHTPKQIHRIPKELRAGEMLAIFTLFTDNL